MLHAPKTFSKTMDSFEGLKIHRNQNNSFWKFGHELDFGQLWEGLTTFGALYLVLDLYTTSNSRVLESSVSLMRSNSVFSVNVGRSVARKAFLSLFSNAVKIVFKHLFFLQTHFGSSETSTKESGEVQQHNRLLQRTKSGSSTEDLVVDVVDF